MVVRSGSEAPPTSIPQEMYSSTGCVISGWASTQSIHLWGCGVEGAARNLEIKGRVVAKL